MAGRACKGCLMGVRGWCVGMGWGCCWPNGTAGAQHSSHQENQESESRPSPSHANTDIRGETAPPAPMHERTWLHTHKHRLIKQHMLLFLLPGAAGGTPLPTEDSRRRVREEERRPPLLLDTQQGSEDCG